MSGAFIAPHALTGGAGYRANPTFDPLLRKHSAFYRRHSAASAALETDRRNSSTANPDDIAAHVAEAHRNLGTSQTIPEGSTSASVTAEETTPAARRGSIMNATAGAATANERRGSVVVGSSAGRKDSVFGLESTRGHVNVVGDGEGTGLAQERRGSTSLASELLHKFKERRGSRT